MSKRVLLQGLLGAGGVALWGHGAWAQSPTLDKFTVAGWSKPITEISNLLAEPEQGFFKAQGIDLGYVPGAGGGGFILLVAKDAAAARKIRDYLSANPPNPLARFFEFDVDQTGLKVTVL